MDNWGSFTPIQKWSCNLTLNPTLEVKDYENINSSQFWMMKIPYKKIVDLVKTLYF